jgi:hypothetical protein
MIVIDNFLQPEVFMLLQNEKYWEKPLPLNFVAREKDNFDNVYLSIVKHGWSAASKLDPTIKRSYEERKGIELWTHILGPNEKDNGLDWHIDKDEKLYEETGKIKTPLYGSIFYCHQEINLIDDMGMLELGTPPEIERIKPLPNRLVIFKSNTPHRVTPGTQSSPRRSIISNLWDYDLTKGEEV